MLLYLDQSRQRVHRALGTLNYSGPLIHVTAFVSLTRDVAVRYEFSRRFCRRGGARDWDEGTYAASEKLGDCVRSYFQG